MRAAEAGRQINGDRDPDPPHDRNLKNSDLRTMKHSRTNAAASEEDQQECAKDFSNDPLPGGDFLHADFCASPAVCPSRSPAA